MDSRGLPASSIFVRSFGHLPELMGLSRSLIVDHPMGRTLGAPGDSERHTDVLKAALCLLEGGRSIVDFDHSYRVGRSATSTELD